MTLTKLHSFLDLTNFYRRFMLGFSDIAWPLNQVIKGVAKDKFVWSKPHNKGFEDLKHCLCLTPLLTLLVLQQPFDIGTNALYYVIHATLSLHGHLVDYHIDTILAMVHKYPTYDKETYSIIQACH